MKIITFLILSLLSVSSSAEYIPCVTIKENEAEKVGQWDQFYTTNHHYDNIYTTNYYVHDGNTNKGQKYIDFTPNITVAGKYDVFMRFESISGNFVYLPRSTNVPIDFVNTIGKTTNTVFMDQSVLNSYKVLIGSFFFPSGSSCYLRLRTDNTEGYVTAGRLYFVLEQTNTALRVMWTFSYKNMDGTPITDLMGGKVYYGTSSSNYTHVVDCPGGTPGETFVYELDKDEHNLVIDATYYLNGTAYNTAGLESDFCTEIDSKLKVFDKIPSFPMNLRMY